PAGVARSPAPRWSPVRPPGTPASGIADSAGASRSHDPTGTLPSPSFYRSTAEYARRAQSPRPYSAAPAPPRSALEGPAAAAGRLRRAGEHWSAPTTARVISPDLDVRLSPR